MNLAGRMDELIVRLSCATTAVECDDTNPGPLLHADLLSGLAQLGALVAIALVVVFVVRARRQR